MQLKIIFLSPFAITAEIENDFPHFSPFSYNVLLNGEEKITNDGRKMFFPLRDLSPIGNIDCF